MTLLLTEDSPVAKVAGPKAAALLTKNKGVHTVGDLLEQMLGDRQGLAEPRFGEARALAVSCTSSPTLSA